MPPRAAQKALPWERLTLAVGFLLVVGLGLSSRWIGGAIPEIGFATLLMAGSVILWRMGWRKTSLAWFAMGAFVLAGGLAGAFRA